MWIKFSFCDVKIARYNHPKIVFSDHFLWVVVNIQIRPKLLPLANEISKKYVTVPLTYLIIFKSVERNSNILQLIH